jgi:surface antigen
LHCRTPDEFYTVLRGQSKRQRSGAGRDLFRETQVAVPMEATAVKCELNCVNEGPAMAKRSTIACIALIAAELGLAASALADPPSHAPAHGWRKKHDPYYVGYTGREWEHDYGIIEGHCDRDAIGAIVGGAVGAAVGSQVGDGSDRVVAIVVGTVIGAAIGREIGRELDDRDRACIGHALELAKDGQSVRWVNENDELTYVVTPTPPDGGDSHCRDFELVISAETESHSERGHACRTADGTWQMNP